MKKDPAQKAIDGNSNLEDLWQEIFQKTIDLSQSYYTYGIKTAEKQMTDDYGIHKAFTSLSEQLLSDPETYGKNGLIVIQRWSKNRILKKLILDLEVSCGTHGSLTTSETRTY